MNAVMVRPGWRAGLLRGAVVGAALALFVALLYYPLLFTNRVLASGDILYYFYPYRDYVASVLRTGHIPLWNPYIFLGAPLLANPQAAVLYPLHWPLIWLPVTSQIAWSAALHTWLLGMGGYALLRRWRGSVWAGLAAALVLAGSGFYGGLVGHINQMNGAAWLPWAVLALEIPQPSPRRWAGVLVRGALLGVLVCLMMLAGHTQTVYINLVGLGVWAVWPFWGAWPREGRRAGWGRVAPRLAIYVIGIVTGVLLSGAQLLPTLELSSLGLRSGGLSYQEASSFSLHPLKLLWTLLPNYGLADLSVVFATQGYTEFVAYVGLAALALALAGAWRGRGPGRSFGLLFIVMGFLLALGRWNPLYYLLYVALPGMDLFRVPARWMMLYTLGMAVLAGLGVDALLTSLPQNMRRSQRDTEKSIEPQKTTTAGWRGFHPSSFILHPSVLCLLIAAELLLAATSLPHAHPTAPQAVYDLRTAPAHLLTDPGRVTGAGGAGRFLGMSTITFDPGDMPDYRRILAEGDRPQLDQSAFDQLIISLKVQELLVPNLSLLWRVPSVDGYDGGVLPLRRYLDLLTLFLPGDELVPDGRLREQVKIVPDGRLLDLLNVQYLLTDKVRDLWYEDVYYDRQIGATLGITATQAITLEIPYTFTATHIDVIGAMLGESVALPAPNRTVAEVVALSGGQERARLPLIAGTQVGAHFADGALDSPAGQTAGATVAYRDVEGERQEYRARLALPEPIAPDTIRIEWNHSAAGSPGAVIQAVTLYDDRTGMFLSLLPSDRGRFRQVHSGDVKLYEYVDGLPRAYLVHEVLPADSPEAALAALRDPAFDPRRAAIVEGEPVAMAAPAHPDRVAITEYAPETVTIHTASDAPGWLVLGDINYPGWQATVDGAAAPILTTNYYGRGVAVPVGSHEIVFRFAPSSWRQGLWVSAAGFALLAVLFLAGALAYRKS